MVRASTPDHGRSFDPGQPLLITKMGGQTMAMPFPVRVVPAKASQPSSGSLAVGIALYDYGFSKAQIGTNVTGQMLAPTGTTIDNNTPGVAVKAGKQWYFIPGGGSGGSDFHAFPAKIRVKNSSTVYQVDVYGNGYANAVTESMVTATLIDLTSYEFSVNDQVTVVRTESAGVSSFWIATSRALNFNSTPAVRYARITSWDAVNSRYNVQIYDTPASATPTSTTTAKEMNGSPYVPAGTWVPLFFHGGTGTNWFFYPLGVA
jgi:hypothetical protein